MILVHPHPLIHGTASRSRPQGGPGRDISPRNGRFCPWRSRKLLGGLAFSIGFIALALARSEPFTEDFLVPVAAVVGKRSPVTSLVRLWATTIVTNLAGGWVVTAIVVLGFTWRAFALALIGGMLITVMTHLQHSVRSDGLRLVPATVMGFLLGAGQVNHAIVASLVCFAALHVGAPFGYLDWLGLFGLAVLGNMIGGLTLVTLFRLLQVPDKVLDERHENETDTRG